MNFIAKVFDKTSPEVGFTDEIEATDFDTAIKQAADCIIQSYDLSEKKGEREVIVVLRERDFNTPPKA